MWVLIVFIFGTGGPTVGYVPFPTEAGCNTAAAMIAESATLRARAAETGLTVTTFCAGPGSA